MTNFDEDRWRRRYEFCRDDGQGADLFLDDLRGLSAHSAEAAAFLRVVEADQLVRTVPTQEEVEIRFKELDKELFGGQLADGTTVEMDGRLGPNTESGSTKNDGTEIYLAPTDLDWEYVLVHEMVHAFEFRFPGLIKVTEEGEGLAAPQLMAELYQAHSAAFFSKLLEVMAMRGHGSKWLFLYFG